MCVCVRGRPRTRVRAGESFGSDPAGNTRWEGASRWADPGQTLAVPPCHPLPCCLVMVKGVAWGYLPCHRPPELPRELQPHAGNLAQRAGSSNSDLLGKGGSRVFA